MNKDNMNDLRELVRTHYKEIGEPDISRKGLVFAKQIIEDINEKYNASDSNIAVWYILRELSKEKHPDRTDWDKIDMGLCPVNDWVDFYYPDGTLICRTNNDIEFLYIRTRIKEMGSVGFYLIFRNEKIEIDKNGNPKDYPDEMFTNFTDLIMKLV